MKKLIAIFVMMSLFSVSCNKSDGGSPDEIKDDQAVVTEPTTPVVENPPVVTPPPVVVTPPTNTTLPALAFTFDDNITLVNFTAAQEQKYNKAIEIVKLVVATEAFRVQVLNFTYAGQNAFIDNRGRTNAQIYQSILDAAETLQPAKNNTMDLEVELYYTDNSVVGYTYGGSRRIWVNTKFFNSYLENSVAANLFHEWLHKLGYTHDSASTPTRPYSVPYAIGYIMGNLGKKFL
ncbi:MAG: hypothetical protein H0V66_03185 [Bdellovibrionales bacterium]|nr:hypothetical protein [Bdellovibrionales bacterium]